VASIFLRVRVPYPFQWGSPTFDVGDVFGIMAAAYASLIEVTFSALLNCFVYFFHLLKICSLFIYPFIQYIFIPTRSPTRSGFCFQFIAILVICNGAVHWWILRCFSACWRNSTSPLRHQQRHWVAGDRALAEWILGYLYRHHSGTVSLVYLFPRVFSHD